MCCHYGRSLIALASLTLAVLLVWYGSNGLLASQATATETRLANAFWIHQQSQDSEVAPCRPRHTQFRVSRSSPFPLGEPRITKSIFYRQPRRRRRKICINQQHGYISCGRKWRGHVLYGLSRGAYCASRHTHKAIYFHILST